MTTTAREDTIREAARSSVQQMEDDPTIWCKSFDYEDTTYVVVRHHRFHKLVWMGAKPEGTFSGNSAPFRILKRLQQRSLIELKVPDGNRHKSY